MIKTTRRREKYLDIKVDCSKIRRTFCKDGFPITINNICLDHHHLIKSKHTDFYTKPNVIKKYSITFINI